MSEIIVENAMLENGLPDFNSIKPEHYLPTVNSIILSGNSLLDHVSSEIVGPGDWESVIEPYLYFCMRFSRVQSIASHLEGVLDSSEWRDVYQQSLQPIAEFSSRWSHSKELYKLFKAFRGSDVFESQSLERKQYVDHFIRDAELDGVDLSDSEKAFLKERAILLAESSNKFANNVLDSTDAWHFDCEDESMLDGVSEVFRKKLIADAPEGVFARISLKSDVVQAILSQAKSRNLREKVFRAWVARASDVGPNAGDFDNTDEISKILKYRHECAKALGFSSHAHLSLEVMDAGSPEEVIDFLEQIGDRAKKNALSEKNKILDFAKENLGMQKVEPWDIGFICEAMRQDLFGFTNEEIRQYFPLDKVLESLLNFAESLYGISFVKNSNSSKYDPWVILYDALSPDGSVVGTIYFDLLSRKGKRGGAWVSAYQSKAEFASEQIKPIIFLVCNFTKSIDTGNALLTHDELVTLFHEFGHAMHCLLTEVKTYGVSGFSGVAWDLVEWPSQWMENWCWLKSFLTEISCHHINYQAMSDEMIDGLHASRLFNSGLHVTKQIQYALTDMLIHSSDKALTSNDAYKIHKEILARFSVWPEFQEQRFLHAFSHIFAGGYSAGYYSYLWAEVAASDSFLSLRELHKTDRLVGKSFKDHVLSVGGLLNVDLAFSKMFGRKMNPDNFLKYLGLE